MKRIIFAALVSAPLLASAAGIADKCTIKAEEGKKKSELLAQAKVTGTQAQATALAAAKADKRVSLKLEEDGCFVYAFVVKDAANVHTAVTVDPGSGKVLRQAKVDAPPPKEAEKAAATREQSAAELAPQAAQKLNAEKAGTSPAVPKAPPPAPPKK